MGDVEQDAGQRPQSQERLLDRRLLSVEPEDADRCIVEPIEHACASRKVIQLFRDVEVSSVEDHAKHPACHPDVAERDIVLAERVRGGYAFVDLGEAIAVREEVEDGEEDGEGLLHAQEAVEGPFAVELHDRVRYGIIGKASLGYDMLAHIVAVALAIPK